MIFFKALKHSEKAVNMAPLSWHDKVQNNKVIWKYVLSC